ncbi:ABC transporter substrate-binding protein [Acinetobacter stercoris]|uniref:2'-hydroxybiphenyl-2-sulfinate desulfinase n=1 Tax=Acinetobacter stercoris TaxID=2126983 RepID=A0A2U3MXV4_9GAMM|nr:ABC transporter substrate-binding protein [Acinetobacter stercoris]SPL70139.1 2'-hydroxybiphenyl-2-sulfinate desulfinase [Acinetobacter stercoris]
MNIATTTPLATLWYTRCPVPTGLGIAVQKGWLQEKFSEYNIETKSIRESNSKDIRNSHFNHTLPNSVRHGGSIPAIWAYSSGQKTRVIGLSWADEIQLLLTRYDSGIQTVADLKGKRFGIPNNQDSIIDFSRAQAIRGLENALKTVDLSVDVVELVDCIRTDILKAQQSQTEQRDSSFFGDANKLNASAEIVALLKGDVDAIFLKGAHAAQVAHDFALHTVIDIGSHPDPILRSNNGTPRTLTVDEDFLLNHPEQVQSIVDSVLKAEQWAHENASETYRYLAKECNSSEHWVHVAYGEKAHLKLNTNFDQNSVLALQDFSDFLYRWKFIPKQIDVQAWLAEHIEI